MDAPYEEYEDVVESNIGNNVLEDDINDDIIENDDDDMENPLNVNSELDDALDKELEEE